MECIVKSFWVEFSAIIFVFECIYTFGGIVYLRRGGRRERGGRQGGREGGRERGKEEGREEGREGGKGCSLHM